MKGKIVKLSDKKPDPHLCGKAKCLHCSHRWVAVSPVGVVEGLECPNCKLNKGVMVNLCGAEENSLVWTCHCGCDVFYLTPLFARCLGCGTPQSWEPDNYIAMTRDKKTADVLSGKFQIDKSELEKDSR